MADPFGIGAGVVGVISLAIQITQVVVQFGLDWKDAPDDVKKFMAELQSLNSVLSGTTSILLNPDFVNAFHTLPSLLQSQLGAGTASVTGTKLMLAACKSELENLLAELEKRSKGHRAGWERFKGAFLAKRTRDAVENLHRQCQTLNSILSVDATTLGAATWKEVKEGRKEQHEWRQSEADQKILNWLTPVDFTTQQNDFISRRQEGTGQWLLDSDAFQQWVNQRGRTMFCPGIPGAGKTILASIVIDYIYNQYHGDPTTGVGYIYFNFRRQHEQQPEDLLSSLLKQLLREQASMPDSVKTLYKRHSPEQTRPSLSEIGAALRSVVANYSRTFIIIDALDEWQISSGDRTKFFSELSNPRRQTQANLFLTSRHIPKIETEFEGSVSMEIRASDDDVRRYLEGHMSQLPSFVSRNVDLQEEIVTEIAQAVDGMYVASEASGNYQSKLTIDQVSAGTASSGFTNWKEIAKGHQNGVKKSPQRI